MHALWDYYHNQNVSGYSKDNDMNRLLIIAIIPILFACTNNDMNKKSSEANLENKIEIPDSLRNSNHYYYLADINPKLFAKWILNDRIYPSDNFSTFRVMDSLEAKSIEDREFYFKVFVKIKEKSDGVLAEAIGLPAMKYVENHTEEFLNISSKYPTEIFESWAYAVGLEIMLSSNENGIDANVFLKKRKENCKNCSAENQSKLDKFYTTMIDAIKQNE